MSDYAIEINNMPFTPIKGVEYKNDYVSAALLKNDSGKWADILGLNIEDVKKYTPEMVEYGVYRQLVLTDLFFILYFVLKIPVANCQFAVDMCKRFESGDTTMTLDIWSRSHFKTSIGSIAETIQYHFKYPERCSIIFAYKKGLAEVILSSVKRAYESEFLRKLFPDVLFGDPFNHSPLWSIEKGIIINRKNTTRPMPTVYASGLVEGMATGLHAERLVFDDIETMDMVKNIDTMKDCYSKFKMACFMEAKTEYDVRRIFGTHYSHLGPIKKIADEKVNGKPVYSVRYVPATIDGTFHGKPVLWSQKKLDEEKLNPHYPMQCLCDPTPQETLVLKKEFFKEVERHEVPKTILKYMLVDWAGDNPDGKKGSSWALGVIGIDLKNDVEELGFNDIYIIDMIAETMGSAEAIEEIVKMYLRNGLIQALGIEKSQMGILDMFVSEQIERRGRSALSKTRGNLITLSPAGRNKDKRIGDALTWPLSNGRIHILKTISEAYKQRLYEEADTFPYGYKDLLDMTAYFYDILKDKKITAFRGASEFSFRPKIFRLKTAVA